MTRLQGISVRIASAVRNQHFAPPKPCRSPIYQAQRQKQSNQPPLRLFALNNCSIMASNGASSSLNNNRLSTASVSLRSVAIPLRPRCLLLLTVELQTTTDASAPAELSAVVDELLNSLSNKFAGVSSEIFAKSTSSLVLDSAHAEEFQADMRHSR
jgi:hypothetical protein